ncbi:type IV secretory system conjugative DNA transfer family protein [Patescibacteria group bacterium]|nr:type IV secretory system conjugative DNA transfer family protein [Patescibacteria group bacterium]
MSSAPRVTLEVRTSRESLQTPEAAVQLLAALPNPPHGLLHSWKTGTPFVLEFLNQGQTIYELVTLPLQMVEYVSSQLTASYPEILIKQLEHNPLQEFEHKLPKAAGEVFFSAASQYPIKTFRETPEGDPLAPLLSALAKLSEGETALVQLYVRKARENWKKHALPAAAADAATQLPASHQSAVSRKLALPSFEVSFRFLAQAQTQERADQIVESLSTALTALQSETNSLVFKKPFIGKKKLERDILHRTHTTMLPGMHNWQYFSIDELATVWHMPNKQLSSIKNIAWGKNLLGEPPENLPTYVHTPEAERNNLNLFARTEFKNQSQIFGIKKVDRRRHMYVIGKSGTGKSTLLANMIINDLKHNEGLAVVDPHGDLIETVLNYIPRHRINDVIIFDPADPHAVVKMNLFEGGSLVHRELIASGIVAIFQKMYANSWGPRLEYILRNALLTLLTTNAKLEDVLRILTDAKYRERVVETLDDQVLKNFWEAEFNTMQERLRTEAVSPILNKVGQFVTSPLIRNVVNTNTSSFDIEEVMNQGKILLVNVSQGKLGEDNMSLLGAMIITKIQLAAMNRVYMNEADRRDFYLYIDEFQNFATTSFIKILSEARKYRLNLVLANQYMAQIPEEVKAAIFGNAGSMLSFILGAGDADYMQKEFGGKYSQEDLVSLGRYKIVTKLMIDGQVSHPFPAETLSLASSSNMNREKVLTVSRERYAKRKK